MSEPTKEVGSPSVALGLPSQSALELAERINERAMVPTGVVQFTRFDQATAATVIDKYTASLREELRAAREANDRMKEGAVTLERLNMTPGAMEAHFKQKPEVAQWIGQAFASMVARSPNYTEMKFEPTPVSHDGSFEWITVTIQKGSGKTPHQLRQEAEAKLAASKGGDAEGSATQAV